MNNLKFSLFLLFFFGALVLTPKAQAQTTPFIYQTNNNYVLGNQITLPQQTDFAIVSPYTKLRNTKLELSVDGSYTNLDFIFKTDVLSILHWDNLNVYELNLSAKYNVKRNGYVAADVTLGSVIDGRTSDDDVENNLHLLSIGGADGNVRNFKFTIGMNGILNTKGVSFSPYVGYSRKWSRLNMIGHYAPYTDPNYGMYVPEWDGSSTTCTPSDWDSDGDCIIDSDYSTTVYYCADAGMDANCITQQYTTIWSGPLMGINITKYFNGFDDAVNFRLEFHLPYYTGIGNWPLRDDMQHPKSFVDEGWGWGFEGEFAYKQKISMGWLFNFKVGFEYFGVQNGDTTDYPIDPDTGDALSSGFYENGLLWAYYRTYTVYAGFTRLIF